jgi:hypothetical protein
MRRPPARVLAVCKERVATPQFRKTPLGGGGKKKTRKQKEKSEMKREISHIRRPTVLQEQDGKKKHRPAPFEMTGLGGAKGTERRRQKLESRNWKMEKRREGNKADPSTALGMTGWERKKPKTQFSTANPGHRPLSAGREFGGRICVLASGAL